MHRLSVSNSFFLCHGTPKRPLSCNFACYLEAAVPVQQLEHRHELLELQHGAAAVRLKHEPERSDARVRVVHLQLVPVLQAICNKMYEFNPRARDADGK